MKHDYRRADGKTKGIYDVSMEYEGVDINNPWLDVSVILICIVHFMG